MNEQYFIEAGKEYCSTGEYSLAQELFKRAVEVNPESLEAHFELGKCYFIDNKFAEAAEALEKASALNTSNPYVPLLLGKSFKMLSDFLRAKEALEKAKALNPDDGEIAAELREIEEALKRTEKKEEKCRPEEAPRQEEEPPAPGTGLSVETDAEKEQAEAGPQAENAAPLRAEGRGGAGAAARPAAGPAARAGAGEGLPAETRGERKTIPPHRVCITWLLNNKCNYRCSYCQNDFKEPEGFTVLPPERWAEIWKSVHDRYGTCAIQLTGGEPTFYPRFFEVLREVAKLHFVEMQTNLSWEPRQLIDTVSPDRVSRVGASFHQEFEKYDSFIQKMRALKDAGFKVEITYVAYPPYLEKGKDFLRIAREAGVPFSVLSFQGEYQGKRYPESYSQAEIDALAGLNHFIGSYAQAMANWDVEHKVVVDKIEDKN
ncbi:MAG: radical SAM protein, partial [Endomicrobiales bacterium]